MASKLYGELSKGEFNEAGKPKTSVAKYSREFIDFAAPNTVFEAVRQTLHNTIFEKVCGQTILHRSFFVISFSKNARRKN